MKMRHITIHSSRIEESVAFYEEITGLTVQRDLRGNGPLDIVFLADREGDTCIELIGDREESFSGSGISIGFAVSDLEGWHQKLSERYLDPTPIIRPNPATAFFLVNDPNGVPIQFIEEK
ncbi:MAG: VOC family protein [Emergencia sp.]